jgi:hypothetical protein
MSERVVDYARSDFEYQRWLLRWRRRVKTKYPHLTCQECGGMGNNGAIGWSVIYDPPEICGWCAGVGLVDPARRGAWLRYKRDCKVGIQ